MTARDVAVIREAADLIERMVGGYSVAERTARVMRLRAIADALENGQQAIQWESDLNLEPPSIIARVSPPWRRVLVIVPET